jgi:DDE family transposase
MDSEPGFLGQLGPSLLKVLPLLDERSRRLVLGMAAEAEGKGGTGRVASLSGAAWQTVANGKAELSAEEELPAGRRRRPGGGRKPLAAAGPGLAAALEKLVSGAVRGDPESPLVWTARSAEHLAGELAAAGHPCSDSTVWRMLRRAGFTRQSNSRAQEGRQHPERDGQFRHIAARAREYLAAGDPVISVGSKKKEQAGNYGRGGREWCPAGEPVKVRSRDFPGRDEKHAIPCGVYDEAANAGFVNAGTDANTAALAVESVRRWWRAVGRDACPSAARLLVTCDSGSSNGYRSRGWKAGLSALAQETGLDIEVCRFPPGTSKWNKAERRLFRHISLAWRARPLTSYDVIIDTISRVTAKTGLTALAVLDENPCPAGEKVSDEQVNDLEERCLARCEWHGEWNCALLARPAPPGPPPPPARPPRPVSQGTLNRPALTGLRPADLETLAAALEVPCRARLDHGAFLKRGRRLTSTAPHGGGTPRLTDVAGNLVITRLRDHLGLPCTVIAALFGIDPSGASRQSLIIRDLLARHATPLPPPASPPPQRPLRTMEDLRGYAASHGIEINLPPPKADTSPHATLTAPGTPQTRLILKRCLSKDS